MLIIWRFEEILRLGSLLDDLVSTYDLKALNLSHFQKSHRQVIAQKD